MDIDFIEDIIKKYRAGISAEKLQELLDTQTIQLPASELLNNSNIFSLYNGLIFLKTSLNEMKKEFLNEFEDFIKSKIDNLKFRKKIIQWCKYFIPDVLFIEWIDISLERKIIIFDMLYTLIIMPNKVKNRLKNYFIQLVNFYSTLTIYLKLLLNDNEEDFENFVETIKKIEKYENILNRQLFNILIIPDVINIKLQQWKIEFNNTKRQIKNIFKHSFKNIREHSPILFERVVQNDLADFNILLLLSRFEFKTLLDWLLFLSEEKKEVEIHHSLFDDLDLQ